MSNTTWESVLKALKRYWGYDSFRHPQDDIVAALLEKRDALILLPTGYGKSICFQLPAVFGSGVTLVVSPLIALMEDQVRDLVKRKLPAAALHSELKGFERQQILGALEVNRLRLLYLSPETLFSSQVWERLTHRNVRINGLMIDEAHTLVHWGDSFRPDYRRLGTVRPALGKHFPIAAFTATADPYTQQVLQQVLGLDHPEQIQVDPYRDNLHLTIKTAWSPFCRQHLMKHFIWKQEGASGLVYVRTRPDGRALADWFNRQGMETEVYHGGVGSQERRQLEGDWLSGKKPFLVCTNAFGMGVNKPDVRWVVHYHPPLSVTDYLQEVGRGGRDGKVATTLMLVSEPTGFLDPTDRQRQDFFLKQRQQSQAQAIKILQLLPPQGSLQVEIQRHGSGVMLSLALLHQAGCLTWQDPFQFKLHSRPRQLKADCSGEHDRFFTDPTLAMSQLIETRQCRWQILLQAFGYPSREPCGNCDNCQSGRLPRATKVNRNR